MLFEVLLPIYKNADLKGSEKKVKCKGLRSLGCYGKGSDLLLTKILLFPAV